MHKVMYMKDPAPEAPHLICRMTDWLEVASQNPADFQTSRTKIRKKTPLVHNSKNLDITFELCKHGYSSGQGNFVTPTLHRHSSHILLTKNAAFESRLGPHSLIFGHPASRAVPSSSTQEIFKGRCPLQPFCCHNFANSKA